MVEGLNVRSRFRIELPFDTSKSIRSLAPSGHDPMAIVVDWPIFVASFWLVMSSRNVILP